MKNKTCNTTEIAMTADPLLAVVDSLIDFEPKFGEIFIHNEKKYQCVYYDGRKCYNCAFNQEEEHDCKIKCDPSERKDKKSTMIVRVGK